MNRFKGFVIKEFYHIFRDKRSLIILFGMPIAQILLFGFAITNELKEAPIAILDHARDEVSREVTSKMLSSGYFLKTATLQSEVEIEEIFQAGEVKAVVVFPRNLSEDIHRGEPASIQVLTDATEPNTATSIVNYLTNIVNDYQGAHLQLTEAPYQVEPHARMYYNPELKGVFMFVPGVMTIILMLISAMMTSISITREKEQGTMEVLMVSPLNPMQVILGKVAPYLLLSFINAGIILLLGVFVFGMPIQGSMILLLLEASLFVVTALALGILISTVTETQQTAMMISLAGLMLPTILLSGFIFPISSMPQWLQWLSNIVPARWFIIIIKGIMLKGVDIGFIWKETLILVGMTLFFIAVSFRKYKIRLE